MSEALEKAENNTTVIISPSGKPLTPDEMNMNTSIITTTIESKFATLSIISGLQEMLNIEAASDKLTPPDKDSVSYGNWPETIEDYIELKKNIEDPYVIKEWFTARDKLRIFHNILAKSENIHQLSVTVAQSTVTPVANLVKNYIDFDKYVRNTLIAGQEPNEEIVVEYEKLFLVKKELIKQAQIEMESSILMTFAPVIQSNNLIKEIFKNLPNMDKSMLKHFDNLNDALDAKRAALIKIENLINDQNKIKDSWNTKLTTANIDAVQSEFIAQNITNRIADEKKFLDDLKTAFEQKEHSFKEVELELNKQLTSKIKQIDEQIEKDKKNNEA